jgi:hypothetical protein
MSEQRNPGASSGSPEPALSPTPWPRARRTWPHRQHATTVSPVLSRFLFGVGVCMATLIVVAAIVLLLAARQAPSSWGLRLSLQSLFLVAGTASLAILVYGVYRANRRCDVPEDRIRESGRLHEPAAGNHANEQHDASIATDSQPKLTDQENAARDHHARATGRQS